VALVDDHFFEVEFFVVSLAMVHELLVSGTAFLSPAKVFETEDLGIRVALDFRVF